MNTLLFFTIKDLWGGGLIWIIPLQGGGVVKVLLLIIGLR